VLTAGIGNDRRRAARRRRCCPIDRLSASSILSFFGHALRRR
jgi:hypothetical protein